MQVKNAKEALFIAVEMERRAVRLYERALLLWGDGECGKQIRELLKDENEHLRIFTAFSKEAGQPENAHELFLSAQAAHVLFPGGLMEAQRHGAFESPEKLIAYAADQEAIAVENYKTFAKQCEPDAAQAFEKIAREEEGHLEALEILEGK